MTASSTRTNPPPEVSHSSPGFSELVIGQSRSQSWSEYSGGLTWLGNQTGSFLRDYTLVSSSTGAETDPNDDIDENDNGLDEADLASNGVYQVCRPHRSGGSEGRAGSGCGLRT